MTPWADEDDSKRQCARSLEVLPPRFECTEAERAYLNAILDGGVERKKLEELRAQIAAERLGPTKRRAIVRAWADSILAYGRREKELEGVDLGGYDAPLYRVLQEEAEALAESERPK